VKVFFGVGPLKATAQLIPFARGDVYVKAGVDTGVWSAGGGAEMTLLDFQMRLGADLAVGADKSRGPYLDWHVYVHTQLKMLSGNAFAYVSVWLPRLGVPPVHEKELRYELFRWKGVTVKDGYLLNKYQRQYLTR
jgi:hypothetical protein